MIKVDVLTVFPEQISEFTEYGIFRIAKEIGAMEVKARNLRDWTKNRHKTVDDRPFGGGPGMLLKIEPIYDALEDLRTEESKVIAFTPSGELLTQPLLKLHASQSDRHYILLAGHYEGFDQRVLDNLVDIQISVGEYILSGGELPALTFLDGLARLLPGVLGNEESPKTESFEEGVLEYAQYTRPEDFKGWKVPKVLLSGNHKEIEEWRKGSSNQITASRKRVD